MLTRLRLIKTFSRRRCSTNLQTKSRDELLKMLQKIESDNELSKKLGRLDYAFNRYYGNDIHTIKTYSCGPIIPPEIGLLTNLEELTINIGRCGDITLYFPPEIGELPKLKQIYFDKTNSCMEDKISKIVFPKEIRKLRKLTKLDLSWIGLMEIPKEIGLLENLKVLKLGGNELTSLPKELSGLDCLEELFISGNKLKTFPLEICNFSNLKTLYMTNNKLTTIPNEINKIKSLENIWLNKNLIAEIPVKLFSLPNLKSLDLSNNEIVSIPDEIENLKQLERFNISDNKIKKLPKTLMNFGEAIIGYTYDGRKRITFGNLNVDFTDNKISNICTSLE